MRPHSRLAQLLRLSGAVQLAAAFVWIAWLWPRWPDAAVAGGALILFFPPLVLAFEFFLLARIGDAGAHVSRPSAGELVRAWAAETHQQYRIFYGIQPFLWRDPPDLLPADAVGRQGVVLIHGFVCNRGFWRPWLKILQRRGHPCIAVNLEPVFGSIDEYTAIVEDAVQRVTACTGRPPVLICHSMGGLVARSWLRTMRATQRVHHVVTIGSPHHGTWLGRFSSTPNGRQMRLGSQWLRQLAQDEARMPQPPRTCWYSNCDNIVFPATTATLPDADNRLLPGAAHVELAFQPEVIAGVLATLSAMEATVSR